MIAPALAAVLILVCAGCAGIPSSPPSPQLPNALDATFDRYASELPPGEGIALRVEAGSLDLVWAQARGAGVDPAQAVRLVIAAQAGCAAI